MYCYDAGDSVTLGKLYFTSQLADFVDKCCLKRSVKCIKEIADHVKNVKRVGPGHGEWNKDQTMEQ